VAASAFLFDEETLGAAEARRRVLRWWTAGASLRRTMVGLVLILPAPRRVAVSAAPGLPLVAQAGALVGCEATAAEIRALGSGGRGLVVARGGQVQVVPEGEEVAPQEWIALGPVTAVATRALSAPRPISLESPGAGRPLHELLGPAIPPPAEQREAFLRDAKQEAARHATGLVPSMASLLDWFRALLRRRRSRSATTGFGRERTGLMARLRELVARAQRWVGLHRLLGRRHGRYLASLIEMLSGGDLREGLRHAIPLEAAKEILERRPPRPLSWRLPAPRSELAISPVRAVPGSSLALGGDLFAYLRGLYRRTFEQLDAQGRHEEAAFVLAELLQADEEAVAYLERNGQLRRAAELAEARGCAPGLIVRAWFLAGDRDRAVRLARLRGAFHDAIARLEGAHREAARQLRLLWADSLAASGNYADAVALVYAMAEARHLVLRWLEVGLGADEAQAPRLLALQSALAPERWAQTRALAELWLASQDESAAARRRALVEALPRVPVSAGSQRLARLCTRSVLAHGSADVPAISWAAIQLLLTLTDDEALQADLPSTARQRRTRWLVKDDVVTATIEPRGPVPARDAVVLPSGRLLVAQGEAGVVLLGRAGTFLHRFDCPADSLVVSDANDRAIALAARGEATQLTQLDLPARRQRAWGLVSIRGGAKTYDGSAWFVHDGSRVMALDAMAAVPRCFWAVDIQDDVPVEVLYAPRELGVLTAGWGMEWWRYELPGPTLRERRPFKVQLEAPSESAAKPVVFFGSWPAADGTVYSLVCDLGDGSFILLSQGASRSEVRLPLAMPAEKFGATGVANHELFALALAVSGDAEVRLFDTALRLRAQLRLPGTTLPHLRFCGADLVIAADAGRVTIFDTERGSLRTVAAG
jgi:hypothetical protein